MVRKIDGLMKQDDEFVHGPFRPEPVRDGDPVSAKIDTGAGWKPIRIWNYTPFGVDILNPQELNLSKGDKLSLQINLANEVEQYDGLTVSRLFEEQGRSLAGIRTFVRSANNQSGEERRASKRWTCSTSYLPTGTAPNPLRYNDHLIFRVENISSGGLLLATSLRNKLVGRNQRLNATLTLPLVGIVRADLVVKHIDTKSIDGKEYLLLGTQFIHPDELLKTCLGEYLLHFAQGVTVQSLKSEGFPIKRFASAFDFTYCKTEEEYKEVLSLRHRSYLAAKKIGDHLTPTDMADEFDSKARILVVKNQGRIVGSVRMIFHADGDQTEHGRYVGIPEGFPKLSEVVECSRMCASPDFQGVGLIIELLAHMVLTTIKSGRRYLLSGAHGSLLKFYGKSGWGLTGIKYQNVSLGGLEHELMLMDTFEAALGKGIGIGSWAKLYGGLIDYMIQQELVTPTPYEQLRIKGFQSLGKIMSISN